MLLLLFGVWGDYGVVMLLLILLDDLLVKFVVYECVIVLLFGEMVLCCYVVL